MAMTPQFDLKGHLLSLRGLTPESTKMARFYRRESHRHRRAASDSSRVLERRWLMLV